MRHPNRLMPTLDLPDRLDEGGVFRSLFLAYPDALLMVDAGGAIAAANPAAAELLGYSVDELVGLPVDTLVPDAIRPRHAAYRAAYAHAPRARPMGTEMELVARRKDGSEAMVEIALSPLHPLGLPYVAAAIRDVGAYPRVKQALTRARYADAVALLSRLAVDTRDPQLLLQRTPETAVETLEADLAVVYLLDPDRMHLRVASGVGLLAQEPVGSRAANTPRTPSGYALAQGAPVVIPSYRDEKRFDVPSFFTEAGLMSGLVVPLTDRGAPIGSLSVRWRRPARIGDAEVNLLQSLCNLLASGLQRAQTEEVLNHAQRLESVGKLTGGIAHDFNNLLTVIQGNLQVLEERPALADDTVAPMLVSAAARATRRGAELTAKLLAFSRRQVLKPGRVDVRAMLQSLAGMLRRTVDQRIRIEVDAHEACPPVVADAGQLESALLNIAINARDAMPQGGRLTLACRTGKPLPPDVDAELGPQESDPFDYVAIELSDTGCGMAEAVRERAFEPFFTTKESGRGTGLGLSTVYGFAKQSKGAAALDSAPGAGTTVTLYLPRDHEGDTIRDTEEVVSGRIPHGLQVLLVEDDAAVRAVVKALLGALGCEVTTCTSAEQALETVKALEPTAKFDLVLTDVALGSGLRGTELAHRLRATFPGLATLLMSGFSSELLDSEVDEPGARELLLKPFSRQDLARAIVKALAAGPAGAPAAPR